MRDNFRHFAANFELAAQNAADQFAHLEALFDAIRDQAAPKSHLQSLADLGQRVASRYSAEATKLSEQAGTAARNDAGGWHMSNAHRLTVVRPGPLDAQDQLSAKSAQLAAFLCSIHGEGFGAFNALAPRYKENLLWLAADLACEVQSLVSMVDHD